VVGLFVIFLCSLLACWFANSMPTAGKNYHAEYTRALNEWCGFLHGFLYGWIYFHCVIAVDSFTLYFIQAILNEYCFLMVL
jgi:hypothetical protein